MSKYKFIDSFTPILRNKYLLTILLFLLWMILLDSNNLINRLKEIRELHKLMNDREYYLNKIEADRRKLQELRTDDDNLEKFAREQYRMKKPDEDLYIILTPKEDRKISRRNN